MTECAVLDCENEGRPQACPYDGQYHRYGCIYYDCGYPLPTLKFREEGWYWMCDEHFQIIIEAAKASEKLGHGRFPLYLSGRYRLSQPRHL